MPVAHAGDPAAGRNYRVLYHGGSVMGGQVHVHAVFWAPPGFRFGGSPGGETPGYVPLVQQFLGDVAHDSGGAGNVFGVLGQYGDGSGPGRYSIAFDPAADTIIDTDPYPRTATQCGSPAGIVTCVTDRQVGAELARVIAAHDPGGVGLHDLWEVFLPPNVDECIGLGSCGTTAFAGYHSVTDAGHGPIVYALIVDPSIEFTPPPGSDPQGNPDAEAAIDVAAHETVEAVTDPLGTGWMDPNGYEVGDKCEIGPQDGTPLGYAPNGSPYDQVINGHQYEIQTMWSNPGDGCVQSAGPAADGLPLPRVSLRQFSPAVRGSIARAQGGVEVRIALLRAGQPVALADGTTRRDGSWGPLLLRDPRGGLHGVGDDRDLLVVAYGKGGPPSELIATGSGGDPFSEAGWTSWLDLDRGLALGGRSITISPCGQTGVLTLRVDGAATASPLPLCAGETDTATVPTPPLRATTRVVFSSEDNRAVSSGAPLGAEVVMTVVPGEPGSVGPVSPTAGGSPFRATGMPACEVDLRRQTAACSGLVPGAPYRLVRVRGRAARAGRAGHDGVVHLGGFPGVVGLRGGDVLRLVDRAGRVLSTMHVARLRAAINGSEDILSGGTCQRGEYFGPPLRSLPGSPAVNVPGATGRGRVCPLGGRVRGLPAAPLAQVDDRSGGVTWTSVPQLTGEAPGNDAIVYGAFVALAQTGVPAAHAAVASTGARVALTVTPRGGRRPVFRAADVARGGGVSVPALPRGVYLARWVVRDLNGDTRTVLTRFVVAG